MSTKDSMNGDTEFDAFLRREGELAALLQTVPQPESSAGLDASILADAEAALAGQATVAANDARIPESSRRPTFISRWKIPLGLAASLLLALPLVLRLWHAPASQEAPVMIAAAPAVSEPMPAPMSKAAQDMRTGESPDRTNAAKATAPMPRAAARSPSAKDQAHPRGGQSVPIENRSEPPTLLAQADTTALKAEPPAAAPAQEAAAKPARIDAPQAAAEQPAFAGALRARTAPSAPVVAEGASNTVPSKADAEYAKPARTMPPLAQSSIANAPPAVPAAAAPPSPAAVATGAAATTIQSAPLSADLQKNEAPPEKASSWLLRIDKLIKTGKQKEALEEWTRFRHAYPNFTVPAPLLKQIEELRK